MSTKLTINPWQKFRGLIPDGARTYGTVASVDAGSNSSVVTLQNSDQVIVKGSGQTTGTRVLIADGEIRQAVPSLPFAAIDLY